LPRTNPALTKLRRICLGLPETSEKEAWGAPTFRVRGKLFAHYRENHHGDGRLAAWLKAEPGVQHELVEADAERFFVPPYVGPSGWVGVRLERSRVDWGIVRELVHEAWQLTAPPRLRSRESD
jgi:hypothetical protein